jgi:hypothetical protein
MQGMLLVFLLDSNSRIEVSSFLGGQPPRPPVARFARAFMSVPCWNIFDEQKDRYI